ncbi:MAG: hypothetical protein JO361_10525, partial [Gammaproteobacteria bacterium]|nr:hypothetical protein [Gammaproteobacteria bacterium]
YERKLNDHYEAAVRVSGDAAASLAELARGVRARSGWRTRNGTAAAHRARILAGLEGGPRAMLAALGVLRASLAAEALVFTDMTQIAYLGNFAFTSERPGAWFHPCGYGTLGYALPAAIGARIAEPRRPVVALAGDFGFQFTLQELATAVELELPVPIVLWNNGALGQIRDDMIAAGITPLGVVGRNPDFMALAEAYGAHAVRVRSAAALGEALAAALPRSGPTLIELVAADFPAG